MMVYVLLMIDPSRTGTTKEHPIGVVTDEAVAEGFYKQDHKNRDYVPFILDEVPEIAGEMSSYRPPEPTPAPAAPATPEKNSQPVPDESTRLQDMEATRRKVEETTKRMQQMMEQMRNKRRSK